MRLINKLKLNKIKKSFDSIEEFIEAYYKNSNKTENYLEYRAKFINTIFCPKCKEERKSINLTEKENSQNCLNEHIVVKYYRTDDKSWLHLCGREGYIFKCTKHNIEVYNMVICMN